MKDFNYGYYLVAFIDVLGQKEAFRGIIRIPTNEQEKNQLVNAHKGTVFFVETLRESFKDVFDEITKETESLIKVPKENKEQFDEIRKATLKYAHFSDCIQAFVPLSSDKYHVPCINGIFGLLGACGGIMVSSLACRKPLRIGIDVGVATELNNGEVYGPAFFNAYNLEKEIANFPRIVIGNELINYLINLINKNPQFTNQVKVDIELCSDMAKRCMDMIVKDKDGYYILDYLGNAFQDNFTKYMSDEEKKDYSECIAKAKSFVEAEHNKWKEKRDNKLAVRYSLLCDYFKNKE